MKPFESLQEKIKSPQEIATSFKPLRGQYRLVTTNGCFDLLHRGHLKSLVYCASLSPYCVVLINSDTSVKKLKGPSRPIQDETTRSLLVAALSCVWRVALFSEETPMEALKTLRPDIHVKGEDYKDKDIPEAALMRELGGKMAFFPLEANCGTTQLIEKIKSL